MIIHSTAAASGVVAGGLVVLPGSDNVIITPIMVGMVAAIGKCCGKDLEKADILSILKSASLRVAGRVTSQVLTWQMPLVGPAMNIGSAAVATDSLGWAVYDILCEESEQSENGGGVGDKEPYNLIPIEDFKSFVVSLDDKELQTRERRNKFLVDVLEEGFYIEPKTNAPKKTISNDIIEQFLDMYAMRKSLKVQDYREIGVQATYLLAILGKYLGK